MPKVATHGTTEEVRSKLKRLKVTNWRQQGNTLYGDTPMGPLVQKIPTDYILIGTDEEGLPKFKKIVL